MRSTFRSAGMWILYFLLYINSAYSQGDPPKPTFPDVFETEVQAVFRTELEEIDASVYYDRTNNRAALFYTYQDVFTKSIYNFNDDEVIYIAGNECSVTKIPTGEETSFFPYTIDKNNKKILEKPEKALFFDNSTFDSQELFVFPSYIYKTKLDFPQFGRNNCDVVHVFSRPEIELPTCASHACKPIITAISVRCNNEAGEEEVNQVYNFYRFRPGISDQTVFQVPAGVHCDIKSKMAFPVLPSYFSFSFDMMEPQENPNNAVFSTHKKVWYDAELKQIRIDEYDDDGLSTSSRIFDLYGRVAYTIISSLAVCTMGAIEDDVALHEITLLPKAFFGQNSSSTSNNAVFVGKRSVQGIDYFVWSSSKTDEETDAKIVEEFYFIKNIPKEEGAVIESELIIANVVIYTYEMTADVSEFQLSSLTYLSINNFRSQPKNWEAFDVASCYKKDHKKGFALKIKGPAVVKGGHSYEEVLELLYMKLVNVSGVCVIRISELTGVFDGVNITEFRGWLLDKSATKIAKELHWEPDIDEAYQRIKDAISAGKLTITVHTGGKYVVTSIEDLDSSKSEQKSCYSGVTLAAVIFILLIVGMFIGVSGYYIFLKKRKKPDFLDKVQLYPASQKE
ncbi:hypothetical protein X975_19816, partial [Stegodyphus mimosarum]